MSLYISKLEMHDLKVAITRKFSKVEGITMNFRSDSQQIIQSTSASNYLGIVE